MTDLGTNRKNSQNIAPVAKGQGGGERPAARWQDKSREERGGRSVGKGAMIKDLARCAPANERLPIRTSYCNYRQERTSRSERDDTRR
jgi:hypothetical protein